MERTQRKALVFCHEVTKSTKEKRENPQAFLLVLKRVPESGWLLRKPAITDTGKTSKLFTTEITENHRENQNLYGVKVLTSGIPLCPQASASERVVHSN